MLPVNKLAPAQCMTPEPADSITSPHNLYLFLMRFLEQKSPKKLYRSETVERAERWAHRPLRKYLRGRELLFNQRAQATRPFGGSQARPNNVCNGARKSWWSPVLIQYAEILQKGIPRDYTSNLSECCALLVFLLDMFEERYLKYQLSNGQVFAVGTSKLKRNYGLQVRVQIHP
jgi:hypothetical protein